MLKCRLYILHTPHAPSEWSSQVCADAYKSFLRAAELGCSLGEPWLVSNAAAYLWNYSCHCIAQGRLRELVGIFRPLLASIKQAQIKRCTFVQCLYTSVSTLLDV